MIAFCLVNSDHGALIVNRFDYGQANDGTAYGVGCQILENGCYDPRSVETLKALLQVRRVIHGDGVVAFDGGANIGVHTVEWSRFMEGWGSVVAVEAQERVFYALAGNIALHNCFNARAVLAALDDKNGRLTFKAPDYRQFGSFGSLGLKGHNDDVGQVLAADVTVQTMTVDSFNLDRLDLLKLDVEGMEMAALRGAVKTITKCRPVMFVEVIKSDKTEIRAFLEHHGYKVFPQEMDFIAVHKDDETINSIERN